MSKIEISHEELIEDVLGDWYVEEIYSKPWKHDVTQHTVVFYKDSKYYQLSYFCSYEWGIDSGYAPYDAYEVKPVEVTTREWKIV